VVVTDTVVRCDRRPPVLGNAVSCDLGDIAYGHDHDHGLTAAERCRRDRHVGTVSSDTDDPD
jgi:hypothetical protein